MLHDMMMRGLLLRTPDRKIRHVRRFAAYLGRPPDMATAEDLRNFQIHQRESGADAGTSMARCRRCASFTPSRSGAET
jgi:hypothetical protein